MLRILVVSDATGETAERVVRSALVQFSGAEAAIQRRGNVQSPEDVQAVVAEAAGGDTLILHTLVSDELRSVMLTACRTSGVDSMDLMGPLLDRLAAHLQLSPQEKPGLFRVLAEVKAREIEAIEFAIRHDDGAHPEELDRAEVVLVGVSRTMKTPTTIYLAYRGWFAANVPIIPTVPLPETLARVERDRVFCLIMTPNRLAELRRARADYLGFESGPYSSLREIRAELSFSQRLCRANGWRQVDATGKSVEEAAREIITLLPPRPEGQAG
jgi:regulator of PEP synthase PpsR (kinase-PPPase family)